MEIQPEYFANGIIQMLNKRPKVSGGQVYIGNDLNKVLVYAENEAEENYNVKIYLSREGYFKKITLQSLRGNDEHKLKDSDEIICSADTDNEANLIFITDKCQLYRARVGDFDCVKASSLGDYIPAKLNFEDGELTNNKLREVVLEKRFEGSKNTDLQEVLIKAALPDIFYRTRIPANNIVPIARHIEAMNIDERLYNECRLIF